MENKKEPRLDLDSPLRNTNPHLLQGSSALDFTRRSDLFGQLLSRLFPHRVSWPRHDIRSRACSPPLRTQGQGWQVTYSLALLSVQLLRETDGIHLGCYVRRPGSFPDPLSFPVRQTFCLCCRWQGTFIHPRVRREILPVPFSPTDDYDDSTGRPLVATATSQPILPGHRVIFT